MKQEPKKHVFRKNQIIISALALMIAIAGYLNFAGKELEPESSKALSDAAAVEDGQLLDLSEEDLQAQSLVDNGEGTDILVANEEEGDELPVVDGENAMGGETAGQEPAAASDADALAQEMEQSSETPGEAVMTNSAVGILSAARLNREQVRSKNKETLQEMIDSSAISQEQKQEAVNNMLRLTEQAELEAAAETLLQAKGFTDVIVSITDGSVDVVVDAGELTDAKLAQIEDVVKRKTGCAPEQIVVTPVKKEP